MDRVLAIQQESLPKHWKLKQGGEERAARLLPSSLSPPQMLQPQFKSHNTNEVLEKLFQIVPGENPYRFRDPHQCRRCAVVGNSGNLRGSGYGQDVDGHNFIMR